MICIECMRDKQEIEWAVVYHTISENPDLSQGVYCLCMICIGKNVEYPSLKSIN